jgi:hypothetical protein
VPTVDAFQTVTDIAGTLVTSLAIIVGGVWAYFKFVKGRTYRPRLEVDLAGEWHIVNGCQCLRARVAVKNIGASVVTLRQKGTGLRVSVPIDDRQGIPALVEWQSLRVFPIFEEHNWIEPGETIKDDLLLDLALTEPGLTLLEARLVWAWSKRQGNVAVFARRILPFEQPPIGTE